MGRRVCVMLSGSGRSLANILDHIKSGALDCQVVGVISSLKKARGVEIARSAGIPVEIIRRRDFGSVEEFSAQNTQAIERLAADLVVMAGYLSFYQLPDSLVGKVINIHPSLLPLFGGQGYFGHHVHEAALKAGVRVSGCTVHFVDNVYDNGPYVLQIPVPVLPEDDEDTLACRVFAEECRALPLAISWILDGKAKYSQGQVKFAAGTTP